MILGIYFIEDIFIMPRTESIEPRCAYLAARLLVTKSNRSKEQHSLIANAKTAEDHKKLAAYYRDKAQEAKEKVADHQDMLQA